MRYATALLAVAIGTAGCAAGGPEDEWAAARAGLGAADEDGLLAFVNAAETTFERLDIDCAIRSDSARNIVRHRDGRDRDPGTADDDLFDTVEELDDVPMVGEWTLERLYVCAYNFGYVAADPDACEPVPFLAYDGEYELRYYGVLSELPPALREVADDLLVEARAYAYPDRPLDVFPLRFAEMIVFLEDGNAAGYEVRIVQTIDPECGVQLHIRFTLDSCFSILDVWRGI